MATHTSVGSFVGALRTLPAKIERGQKAAVTAGALHVTTHVRTSIKAASGGDSRLSGVGKKGAKVGAGYDVKGTRNPTALITARGPVHLIERGTKPHLVGTRARRGRRGRARLVIGGQVVTGPVEHPGTGAKRAFSKGVRAALPTVGTVMRKAFNTAAFFGGK